jgi:hypothetical protein
MFDPDVLEACMRCLVGAAVHEGAEADLALAATALARDLADTQRSRATALLDAATRDATQYLDASDLGATSFAAALRRLSNLRGRVVATLAGSPAHAGPLPA